ncbi:MAG: metal-dependent transcriptional regulator [Candidatus Hadarchaeia archaeon]
MRVNSDLTKNQGEYLKYIYREQREKNNKLSPMDLAANFDVKPPTVTEVVRKLEKKNLLNHERYGGVELTEEGVDLAKTLLRKHRLLELLLVDYLGLEPERACKEALEMDFHVSDGLVDSICRKFEHPEICPCGERIFLGSKCDVKEE